MRKAHVHRSDKCRMHAFGHLFLALDRFVNNRLSSEIEYLLFLFKQPLLRLFVILASSLIRSLHFLLGRLHRNIQFFVELIECLASLNHARVFFLVAFFRRCHKYLLCRPICKNLANLREFRNEGKICKRLAIALKFLDEIPLG